jgi:hypothetical protein
LRSAVIAVADVAGVFVAATLVVAIVVVVIGAAVAAVAVRVPAWSTLRASASASDMSPGLSAADIRRGA